MLSNEHAQVFFRRKKIRFVTSLNPIKCLKQIGYHTSLFTCAPVSESLSNISTMGPTASAASETILAAAAVVVVAFNHPRAHR